MYIYIYVYMYMGGPTILSTAYISTCQLNTTITASPKYMFKTQISCELEKRRLLKEHIV